MNISLLIVVLSGFLYLAAAVFYFAALKSKRAQKLSAVGSILMLLGILSQAYWFVARTVEYWHQYSGFVLPAVSAFEAIAFMAFLITLVYYITEQTTKARNYGGYVLLVPILSIAYLLIFLYDQSGPRDLPPALKSYWLPVHIGAMILSYAVLSIAFVIACYYLIRLRRAEKPLGKESSAQLARLDATVYHLTLAAYPVLTLGIFLGAVWANEAWGTYWAWDPKETWALITWLFYTMYLHARMTQKWSGALAQAFNISAYATLLTTFIGVNLITSAFGIESVHSYATMRGGIIGVIALFLFIAVPLAVIFRPRKREVKSAAEAPAAPRENEPGLWELFVGLLRSFNAAVVMLLVFGVICAIGTLLPQKILGVDESQLISKFGNSGYRALNLAGFVDIYRSWYFDLVFLWLSVAALVCTLTRLRGVMADLARRPGKESAEALLCASDAKRIGAPSIKRTRDAFISRLRARGYRVFTSDVGGALVLQADRSAFRRYMPVIFHAALLFIFIGGGIGRIWGYDSSIDLMVGEKTVTTIDTAEGKSGFKARLASLVKPQEYELSLNSFDIEYSKRGVPAGEYSGIPGGDAVAEYESYEVWHYISDLTVSHGGKTWNGRVVVNHPLRAGGVTFYQSSYYQSGYVTVNYDGREYDCAVEPGNAYQIGIDGRLHPILPSEIDPQAGDVLRLPEPSSGFYPLKVGSLYEHGKEVGKLAVGIFELTGAYGSPTQWVVLKSDRIVQFNVPGHMVTLRMSRKADSRSIFQYTRDPGRLLVFLAWTVMILAMALVAYTTFVRVELFWGEDGAIFRAHARGPRPAEAFMRAVEKELQGG